MREVGHIRIDIVGVRAEMIDRVKKVLNQSSFGAGSLDALHVDDRVFAYGDKILYPSLPARSPSGEDELDLKREGHDYTVKWLSIVMRCLKESGFFSYTCVFSDKREIVMERVVLRAGEDVRKFQYEEFGVDISQCRPIGILEI